MANKNEEVNSTTVNGVKWKYGDVDKYNKQFKDDWDKPVEQFEERRNYKRNKMISRTQQFASKEKEFDLPLHIET